ncbi:MAG: hypothetical protein ACKOQZ_01255, partial [Actinomycetota bacterium]
AQAGKGTILALPHLGGWEWAGRWLVGQGYTLTAVVERLDNDELFDWFLGVREELGFNIIPLDDRAGVAVNEALRANHVVALLCDRDIPRDGVRNGARVSFFGETTTVPSGPAFFSLRTGAPIVPLATYFTNRLDGHHAVVRPAIQATREGSLRDVVAHLPDRHERDRDVDSTSTGTMAPVPAELAERPRLLICSEEFVDRFGLTAARRRHDRDRSHTGRRPRLKTVANGGGVT